MTHDFDQPYWERHWAEADSVQKLSAPVHPYLAAQIGHLTPGTALEAGCGTGAEARWLAQHGWQVAGADLSATALAEAARRAADGGLSSEQISWVETDLGTWEPGRQWDLVTTHYAHPATGQLQLYARIADWVAPGGTLLIVGHLHDDGHGHGASGQHGHSPPEGATATLPGITGLFSSPQWNIDAGFEASRTVGVGEHSRQLRDVVVRVHRT
ncbi:MAG: class I SAM-dependent methyltransferase [Micrococcaceae bacterium]